MCLRLEPLRSTGTAVWTLQLDLTLLHWGSALCLTSSLMPTRMAGWEVDAWAHRSRPSLMLIWLPCSLVRHFSENRRSPKCPASPVPQALQTSAQGSTRALTILLEIRHPCNPCADMPEKKKSLAERDFQAARCRLPTRAGMPSWQDLLVPTRAKGWVPEWVRAALKSCTVFSQSLLREFKRCFALAANTVGFSQTKSKKCAEIDSTMLGRGQAVRPAVPSGPQLCESVKIRKVS